MNFLLLISLFNGLSMLMLLITGQLKSYHSKKVNAAKARNLALFFFAISVVITTMLYIFHLDRILNYMIWTLSILVMLSLIVFFISKIFKPA